MSIDFNQIVYVLTNPAMPGLIKIGMITQMEVEARMIARKGVCLLLCLLQASGLTGLFVKLPEIFGLKQLQNSDRRLALA